MTEQILRPKYTMYGFEWQDQRGIEGTGFVRALRSLLTSHLPKFQPDLERIVKCSLETGLRNVQPDGEPIMLFQVAIEWCFLTNVWKALRTWGYSHLWKHSSRESTASSSLAKNSVGYPPFFYHWWKSSCGLTKHMRIAQNTEFTSAALEFPQTVVFTAELLRITPEFMRPMIASIATNRHKAAKTLYRYLVPIVKERLAIRGLQSKEMTPVSRNYWACSCVTV